LMKLSVRSLATSIPRKDIAKAEVALRGLSVNKEKHLTCCPHPHLL